MDIYKKLDSCYAVNSYNMLHYLDSLKVEE
jgi:hypothetical protein